MTRKCTSIAALALAAVLLVLTSTTAASAQGSPYWAVATDVFQIKDALQSARQSYGAAWNFLNREEAKDAAFETCSRESHRGACNTLQSAGKNSCLFVLRWDVDDKYL